MFLLDILNNKPVLIGLHLGFAIIGIDGFLWMLGELIAGVKSMRRILYSAVVGLGGVVFSLFFGGYYFVLYYGTQVKPIIKAGITPWAHSTMMETKEHIFLFLIPLAVTATLFALLNKEEFDKNNFKKSTVLITLLIISIGFAIGIMGYIISAAARWS